MRRGARSGFPPARRIVLVLILLAAGISVPSSLLTGARGEDRWDVFALMAEVERQQKIDLWPGFEPDRIPAAVFDGQDTYLFGFPRPPKEFRPAPGHPGVFKMAGTHSAVFGNRPNTIDGVWTATVVSRPRSPETGRRYTAAEAAAVIIHEKFHVFCFERHPDWRPNDVVLTVLPPDTPASVAARRKEAEALRRAVAADGREEAAGWARAALAIRADRLKSDGRRQDGYERLLHKLEGLAEYVEYKAAGRRPEEGSPVEEFAPRAVRQMGYLAGRRLAVLLDRFVPDWKRDVEADDRKALDVRLAAALRGEPGERSFTAEEDADFSARSERALAGHDEAMRKLERDFNSRLGIRLEIVPQGEPFHFRMIDPFDIDMLAERLILHRQWFVARNESGRIEVFLRPCLTEVDEEGRIVKIVLTGIPGRFDSLLPWRRSFLLQLQGLRISLSRARILRMAGVLRIITD